MMLSKALVCAAFAFAPLTYDDQRKAVEYPLVKKVVCTLGVGTAFRIGPTRFVSVAHVTSLGGCKIDGHPITVIESDNRLDFSIVEAGPPKQGALAINCDGFNAMNWYWSTGYAHGLPIQTSIAVVASAFSDEKGKRILFGRWAFIPGMSGGPVVNGAGEVVGTINAYHPLFGLSYSRALKDTSLCAK